MLDSLFPQSLSKFSLVYLLAWHSPLHTPHISSPNHCLLFAVHDHTIATCFAVVPRLCYLILVSLSLNPLLGTLSCSITPHIHLTILISVCWSATSFSFLTGQVSVPCNILLRTQLLYNLPLLQRYYLALSRAIWVNQLLVKASSADGCLKWQAISSVNAHRDVVHPFTRWIWGILLIH